MKWTTPEDLKAQLRKRWDRGDFLPKNSEILPFKLVLKKPTSREITEQFQAVKTWATAFLDLPHLRVEWQTVNHRIQGAQRLPESVWLDNFDDLLAILHKQKTFQRFEQLRQQALEIEPNLQIWLEKYPLQALDLADDWQKLLAVLAWRKANPQPNCYLRQVAIDGVHTKFIEKHRAILSQWFDLSLPKNDINIDKTGAKHFNARYGFLDKPEFVRFRWLDNTKTFSGLQHADISLDAASFAKLNFPPCKILIVENEITYLSLPPLNNTFAILGAGYGFAALRSATWLKHCDIYYWGDLDTHGFAILNQLRADFPKAKSILMTQDLLEKYRHFVSVESQPKHATLPHLTADEQAVYACLCEHIGLRLEQELIPFDEVEKQLERLSESV